MEPVTVVVLCARGTLQGWLRILRCRQRTELSESGEIISAHKTKEGGEKVSIREVFKDASLLLTLKIEEDKSNQSKWPLEVGKGKGVNTLLEFSEGSLISASETHFGCLTCSIVR